MKKTIQKPENWQDFETLCKQLWGEIWGIPMKIKKNGRNGQSQAGVDLYGVPKGEVHYRGIQCKAKNDNVNAKLTRKEIDDEIAKAQTFEPGLAVFIFATTMDKDSDIEEYVRIKDLESRKNKGFEISLYCWQDIAELIDKNQDTYNFWVVNKQHKTKFDFKVSLNDFQSEYTIRPKYIRKIKKYRVRRARIEPDRATSAILGILGKKNIISMTQRRANEAVCSFKVIMENIGTNVIEDWKVRFEVIGEHKEIMDQIEPRIIYNVERKRTCYFDKNQITYSPEDNEPLVGKDSRCFEAYIIPECKEYTITIKWELLARDFNSSGETYLKVEPEYEDEIIWEDVASEKELKQDGIVSVEEKITPMKNNNA